ncbi:MAG: hypothetical protein V7641_1331 [Blastocatellia bacterium]
MAKTIASLVGVVFILVGICGFVKPDLLGAHLGTVHNVIHLVSGALSLYFGTKGTLGQARTFCIVFGLVYGLLGVVGLVMGELHLPGGLMLGKMDHYIHVLIAVLYLIGGFTTKPHTVTA